MSRTKGFAPLIITLILSIEPTLGAADVTVAPPFDDASSRDGCEGYGLSACSSSAGGDESGAFSISAEMTSPEGGSIPGPARAYGLVELAKLGTIPTAVSALEISIDVHIDEAWYERTGGSFGAQYGYTHLFARVDVGSCSCSGDVDELLAYDGGEALQDEDRRLTFLVRNHGGGSVQPGSISLSIAVAGDASLNGYLILPLFISDPLLLTAPNDGALRFAASGSITSVTARALSA